MASSFDDPLQSTSALPAPQPMRAKPPEPSHLGLSVTPTTAYPTPRTSSRDSKRVSDAMVDQICQACSQGDIETLDDLLEEDAELTAFTLVNSSKKSGLTPLHFAASRGRTAVVEHLFEQGALIMEDSSGETPVHLAALKGHLSTLKALIEVGGQDAAEAQDSDGWTALHNACSKGFLDCVRYLVEDVGVQVDALSKARYTPLMNASGKGSLPVVNYLLSKRLADPMLRSIYGETAYDVAAVSEVFICEVEAQHEAALWAEKQASLAPDERMPYNPLALHVSAAVMLHENQRLDLRLMSLGHRASFTSAAISKNDNRSPFSLPPSYDGLNPTDSHLPVFRSDLGLPTTTNPFQIVLPQIAVSAAKQAVKKRPDLGRARTSSLSGHRKASRSVSGTSNYSEATSMASNNSYFAANSTLPINSSTERAWFWMTEWFIDYSSPRVDATHGWEYARSFDDPPEDWVAEPPLELQRLLEQSTAPLHNSASNKWVRRRRWIRVMRRRLDRPGLPFADLDGLESMQALHSPGPIEEQELADVAAPTGADYVARARFKAGVHHRLSSRESDGMSIRSGKSGQPRPDASKAEARRLVLRLESAISELRIGLLSDEDTDRAQQGSALLETYAARLQEVKAQTPLDEPEDEAEFVYTAATDREEDPTTPVNDYFSSRDPSSSSNRPPDLTPDLRLASEFRVPTQDSPLVRITSSNRLPTAVSMLPRWEPDADVEQCRRCSTAFSFLKRRHHCRKCGRVVCNACSPYMDRLEPEEVVLDPQADLITRLSIASLRVQRTCQPCHEEVVNRANRAPGSPSGLALGSDLLAAMFDSSAHTPGSPMTASFTSEQSVLTECPVCGFKLSSLMNTQDQEDHVRNCLNNGRASTVQAHRYLVFKLGESPLVGQECSICFVEFEVGSEVARMACLCYFHQACLKSWLQRSHGCPLHQIRD